MKHEDELKEIEDRENERLCPFSDRSTVKCIGRKCAAFVFDCDNSDMSGCSIATSAYILMDIREEMKLWLPVLGDFERFLKER